MVLSINFSPWRTLVMATLCGSQVGEEELAAYDSACDYYGKERVVIQKTVNSVEFVTQNKHRDEAEALSGTFWGQISETPKGMFSLRKIRKFLTEKYNPNASKDLFIYWPDVTVSNEKDESIDLKDLFCRIPLFYKGLSFREEETLTFLKTTYTKVQWDCGYIHSHVQPLEEHNPMLFRHVCLGTGPIKNTVRTLKGSPVDELAMPLFFWELDKVAHVESLSGIPYYRLSGVTEHEGYKPVEFIPRNDATLTRVLENNTKCYRDLLVSFFRATPLTFGFKEGRYTMAMPFTEFAITFTNYYKRWKDAVNEAIDKNLTCPRDYLLTNLNLRKYIIQDGKIFTTQGTSIRNRRIPQTPAFKFGNREFPLLVETWETKKENYLECTLVDLSFVASLYEFILTSINTATSKPYEEKQTTQESDYQREQYACIVSGGSNSFRDLPLYPSTSTAD